MVASITAGMAKKIKRDWAQHIFAFVLIIMLIVVLANITEYPILVVFVDQLSFFFRFLLLGLIVQAVISGIVSYVIFAVVALGMNDLQALRFCKKHDSTRVFKLLFIFVFLIIDHQCLYADRNGLQQLRIDAETKQLSASEMQNTRIKRDQILKQHEFIMIGEWGTYINSGHYYVFPFCIYIYNPFSTKNKVEITKEPQQVPTD